MTLTIRRVNKAAILRRSRWRGPRRLVAAESQALGMRLSPTDSCHIDSASPEPPDSPSPPRELVSRLRRAARILCAPARRPQRVARSCASRAPCWIRAWADDPPCKCLRDPNCDCLPLVAITRGRRHAELLPEPSPNNRESCPCRGSPVLRELLACCRPPVLPRCQARRPASSARAAIEAASFWGGGRR